MYEHSGYIEEVLTDDIDAVPAASPYDWLRWVLLGFLIVTPVAIVLSVAVEHIPTCLLAYGNCLFIGFAVWRFLRKGTMTALVPVLFVPYTLLAWPVGIIFFAIFYPDIAYYGVLGGGKVPFFEAGVKVQLCVLLFFIGYFPVMFWGLRKDRPTEAVEITHPGRFAYIAVFSGLILVLLHSISRVKQFPGFGQYLINALFKYFVGLFLICGAMIKSTPTVIRIVLFSSLGGVIFFYTIGNARGQAMYLVATLSIGLLFLSGISRKAKIILVICIVLSFPTYVLVANTTRVLLGTVGFGEGVSYRLKALKEWRTVQVDKPASAFLFGRLFFTGGHSVISRTPSEHPYRRFVPYLFIREALESLLLQRFYYRPYYRGNAVLRDYGFLITEATAVEVSMIGNLWLMGGYPPVFFGGVAVGLLHWLVVWILRRSLAISRMKALVYFGVFSYSLFWGPNLALLSHWRDIVYRIILGFILYQVIQLFVGEAKPMEYYVEEGTEATVEERY